MKRKKTNDQPINSMIQTSRIKFDPEKEGYGILHMDAIQRDFDVFAITYHGVAEWLSERNQSYTKALDILKKAHPVSVSCVYGQRAVLLFRHEVASKDVLNQKLHHAMPDTDLMIVQVNVRDENSEQYLGKHNIYLIQALCNIIANTNDRYSRMDGHLYYTTAALTETYGKKLQKRVALEIVLNKDMLSLKTCTFIEFEKATALKKRVTRSGVRKPLYTVHSTTGKMSRIDVKDIGKTAYVQCNFKGQKSNIGFCDWSSLEKFAKTKCGILYLSFLQDLKTNLSDYINLKFETIPFYHLTTELNLRYKNAEERTGRYVKALKEVGIDKIYVCNHIGMFGMAISKELTNYLEQYQFEVEQCTQMPDCSNSEFVISIIHDKEDYKELKIEDAYMDAEYNVQHYVVPYRNPQKQLDQNVFLKLLAEAVIKTDLQNGHISLVNMSDFISDPGEYIIRIYWITKRKNVNKKEIFEERWYPCMYIDQDGDIFYAQETLLPFAAEMGCIETEERKRGRDMQCVIELHQHKYVISRTDEVGLPREELAMQILDDAKPILSVEQYHQYLREFCDLNQYHDYYKEALKKLDTFKTTHKDCNKEALRSLSCVKGYKEESKAMIVFLQTKGMNTVSSFKNVEAKRDNGLIAYDHVHYRFLSEQSPVNPQVMELVLQYIVAELNINQSLARAAHLYTIRCIDGSDNPGIREDMLSILKMTDVFFVRENAFTVIPFLCKYAREWERVETDHYEISEEDESADLNCEEEI